MEFAVGEVFPMLIPTLKGQKSIFELHWLSMHNKYHIRFIKGHKVDWVPPAVDDNGE